MPTLYLFILTFLAAPELVFAVSPAPPPVETARDSAAARWEEGADLTRWLGTMRLDVFDPSGVRTFFNTDWSTAISRGVSAAGQIRHDARWNLSASRNLNPRFGIFGSAQGQHYIDRPRGNGQSFAQENRSHLLRAGIGPTVRWNRAFKSAHSLGAVFDSREELMQSGLGTWNQGHLDLSASPQVRHKADARFDFETPGDRQGTEAELSYKLSQDYGTTTNLADFTFGWTQRDLLISADVPSQFREERTMRASDGLQYELANGASFRGTGDFRLLDTQIDDHRGNNSRLKELESGLNAEIELSHRQHFGSMSVGVRNATQNVRGEILSGLKTELAADYSTKISSASLQARAAFSKYSLDTRSDKNFDDRDELAWRLDVSARMPLNANVIADVHALVDLNHLVYVFGENSANNRWTRLLLLTSRFVHRPESWLIHVPECRISANFQAYDFELNARQVRSTVYRRVSLSDSLRIQLSAPWSLALKGEWSREELGRLYWDAFEEERSDETDAISTSLEVIHNLSRSSSAGLGAAYSRRKGERFEAGGEPRRVLDIESWGPLAQMTLLTDPWFIRGSGQWVIQTEFENRDRDFISGSITAGRAW